MATVNIKETERSLAAIRFPTDMHDRLRVAANDRDLSVNYLVVKAVQEFLERLIPADELRLTRDPSTHQDQTQDNGR